MSVYTHSPFPVSGSTTQLTVWQSRFGHTTDSLWHSAIPSTVTQRLLQHAPGIASSSFVPSWHPASSIPWSLLQALQLGITELSHPFPSVHLYDLQLLASGSFARHHSSVLYLYLYPVELTHTDVSAMHELSTGFFSVYTHPFSVHTAL